MHYKKKKENFFHHISTNIFLAAKMISIQTENIEHLNKTRCTYQPFLRDRPKLQIECIIFYNNYKAYSVL